MPDAPAQMIMIEVVHALPERQTVLRLAVPPGTTVRGGVESSGLAVRVVGFVLDDASFAVFGKAAAPEQVLRDGDRIEVLRPLRADPKEVRRRLAAQGRTMGKLRDRSGP